MEMKTTEPGNPIMQDESSALPRYDCTVQPVYFSVARRARCSPVRVGCTLHAHAPCMRHVRATHFAARRGTRRSFITMGVYPFNYGYVPQTWESPFDRDQWTVRPSGSHTTQQRTHKRRAAVQRTACATRRAQHAPRPWAAGLGRRCRPDRCYRADPDRVRARRDIPGARACKGRACVRRLRVCVCECVCV
jgi:hypothetical protein